MLKQKNNTNLDKFYELRENFSIIGITGRTGSGCTKVAEILSKDFELIKNIKIPRSKTININERRYEIIYNFNKLNWKRYYVINYKTVLLLILCNNLDQKKLENHLKSFYRKPNKQYSSNKVKALNRDLTRLFKVNHLLINKITEIFNVRFNTTKTKIKKLNDLYWNEFTKFTDQVDNILKKYGIIERINLLHHTSINIRSSGNPFEYNNSNYDKIYCIAEVINKIIKITRKSNKEGKCQIAIDSLRNSPEINYFRERFSGFYLIAVKSETRENNLYEIYGNKNIVTELLSYDENEYKNSGYEKDDFFSPDVQNCIQKADYHIINRYSEDKNRVEFYNTEEQLIKLQGLIQQPGLITPSSVERCMQIAFTSKLSSGCISRQVGAVLTDQEYSLKSIGWNDVPRGAVPCSYRNIKEITFNSFGFSDFEKGIGQKENTNEYENVRDNDGVDPESIKFKNFIVNNYNDKNFPESKLGGINCPYCFKTAYNKFKGENNQVHTRSLHAEENAMMQISKYGGQPLQGGILFTTASPCELCSKKAYQLGVTDIYYVDPYPGISRSHILKQSISNPTTNPRLHMFNGAIGRGYLRLFEPFMSKKDEITILTDFQIQTPQEVKDKSISKMLKSKIQKDKILSDQISKLMKSNIDYTDGIIEILRSKLK